MFKRGMWRIVDRIIYVIQVRVFVAATDAFVQCPANAIYI